MATLGKDSRQLLARQEMLVGRQESVLALTILCGLVSTIAILIACWNHDISSAGAIGSVILVIASCFGVVRYAGIPPDLKFFCPHANCHQYISRSGAWRCCSCTMNGKPYYENHRSFFDRCSNCDQVPNVVACPICGQDIELTAEQSIKRRAIPVVLEDRLRSEEAQKRNELSQQKQMQLAQKREELWESQEIFKLEITRIKLEAERNEATFMRDSFKKKTPYEEMEQDFVEFYSKHMGDEEYATLMMAKKTEEHKDDSDKIEKVNATIRAWLEARAGK